MIDLCHSSGHEQRPPGIVIHHTAIAPFQIASRGPETTIRTLGDEAFRSLGDLG